MKVEVYAVHDSAVGAFNQPLFFRSRGEAVRAFQDAVTDGKSNFAAHPDHYSFFHVGFYDDNGGLLEPIVPERVCGARDFTV